MRLPTALRPRLNFFANASLTIVTFGEPRTSARRELAAGDERHAHGAEIAGADLVEAGVTVDVGPGLESLDLHVAAPVASGEERHERGRDAGDARQRRELLFETREQLARPLGLVGVALRRRFENVTTLSTLIPRSTRLTFSRLLMKRPAQASSVIDSAIWAVASVVRNRWAELRARRLARLALERRDQSRAACCAAPGTVRRAGPCRA